MDQPDNRQEEENQAYFQQKIETMKQSFFFCGQFYFGLIRFSIMNTIHRQRNDTEELRHDTRPLDVCPLLCINKVVIECPTL